MSTLKTVTRTALVVVIAWFAYVILTAQQAAATGSVETFVAVVERLQQLDKQVFVAIMILGFFAFIEAKGK